MKRSRYSSRYLEIIQVLRKNSILKHINRIVNLKKVDDVDTRTRYLTELGEALRQSFETLGPTFIKFGQLLSTRSDIFPMEITTHLEMLQDDVKAFPSNQAVALIEESLGASIDDLFMSFDQEPVAAGSIAQVHAAYLNTGDKVAVKVQRPGIKDLMKLDIKIMATLSRRLNRFIPTSNVVDFNDVVLEFRDQIKEELDFSKEAEYMLAFSKQHRHDKYITVPKLYVNLSHEKVLVMEFIEAKSVKLLSKDQVCEFGEQISRALIYSFSKQVFEFGFFHADLHPGNILLDDDLNIYLTDFGIMGKLSDRKKYSLLKLFMGVSLNSTRIILSSIIELGVISAKMDTYRFEMDLQFFLDKYLKRPLSEIKLADIFREFVDLLYRYDITIDRSLLTLGKSIAILEGVVEDLNDQASLLELAKPIAKKLFRKFVSADYLKNYFLDAAVDSVELVHSTPKALLDFSRRMQESGYEFKIALREDDRHLELARKKQRQNQRNIFLILSVFVFMVSLLVLSFNEGLAYKLLWQILLFTSALASFILSTVSLYSYFTKDR